MIDSAQDADLVDLKLTDWYNWLFSMDSIRHCRPLTLLLLLNSQPPTGSHPLTSGFWLIQQSSQHLHVPFSSQMRMLHTFLHTVVSLHYFINYYTVGSPPKGKLMSENRIAENKVTSHISLWHNYISSRTKPF